MMKQISWLFIFWLMSSAIISAQWASLQITALQDDYYAEEMLADWDSDQVYALRDWDNDADGIKDQEEVDEAGLKKDLILFFPFEDDNNNGSPNYRDVEWIYCEDIDNDGLCDYLPTTLDYDGDDVPNFLDLDSDNDGIADAIEAGNVDSNGDGRTDITEDLDMNGWADIYQKQNNANWFWDIDQDGVPNIKDLDSDNDGIPDAVEAGGTDTDGDGKADDYRDTDTDGWNDLMDGDVGNMFFSPDEFSATWERTLVRTSDLNNDGYSDGFLNKYTTSVNADNDDLPNFWDTDSDNDGLFDLTEVAPQWAHIEQFYLEEDADNDGLSDIVDGNIFIKNINKGRKGFATEDNQALLRTGNDDDHDGSPESYPQADNNLNNLLDLWEKQ